MQAWIKHYFFAFVLRKLVLKVDKCKSVSVECVLSSYNLNSRSILIWKPKPVSTQFLNPFHIMQLKSKCLQQKGCRLRTWLATISIRGLRNMHTVPRESRYCKVKVGFHTIIFRFVIDFCSNCSNFEKGNPLTNISQAR